MILGAVAIERIVEKSEATFGGRANVSDSDRSSYHQQLSQK
jgi:hypothetical protein